jgi:hypothetical protein
MYYKEKSLNFIHIPKTGGSAIEHYIVRHIHDFIGEQTKFDEVRHYIEKFLPRDSLYYHNTRYHVMAKRDGCDEFKNSFCVLRDPFEIRKSAFYWLCENRRYKKDFNTYICSGDFKKFPKDNREKISSFGRTQCDYIMDDSGKIIVKKIFLYEKFNECLDYIDLVFEKKISRPPRQINKSKGKSITMSRESECIIEEYFSDDFDLLRRTKTERGIML